MPKDDATSAVAGHAAGQADDTQAWLDRVAAIGPILEEDAAEGARIGKLTDRAMAALHEQGLFRMMLPAYAGGAEIALPTFFPVIEAIAGHDASAAWCVCQGNGCTMLAAYINADFARELWANDPAAVLAWGPGRATARAVDGGYEVTAHNSFVSGSRHATWLGSHCNVVENDGTPRLGPDGTQENRTCVIPADQVTMIENWDVLGLRATGSDSFTTDKLFVPENRTIVRAGMIANRHIRAPAYLFPQTLIYAMGFSATALGIARAFFDAFVGTAQDKKPRLASMALKENPVVHDEVARLYARWSSARAFVTSVIDGAWREACETDDITLEQRMHIRLSATYAIHEAKALVDTLYDTAGTSAVFTSSPFERRFRDMHTVALQIQGRKTHFATVGSWLLGNQPDLNSL